MSDSLPVRIEAAVLDALGETVIPAGALRALAIGWATVDLERAATELASALDFPYAALVDAYGSGALGARCRIATDALPGGLSLAILEPSTEGRLAATLARHGEGPAVVWYVALEEGDSGGTPTRRLGPFGPERLVPGDPVHGPHRLLVDPGTGTIAS